MKLERYTTKAYYVYYTPQLGRRKEGWIGGLGKTEQESVQSFVADLAGQMGQETTVPPDTQMVQAPESGVNYDAIDSDAMAIS